MIFAELGLDIEFQKGQEITRMNSKMGKLS